MKQPTEWKKGREGLCTGMFKGPGVSTLYHTWQLCPLPYGHLTPCGNVGQFYGDMVRLGPNAVHVVVS